ncbi:MAG: hypothetical protein QOJ20_6213 [Mycobacterium sp.]|jgi:hypothetical protein|nr:hypothetical protein [Mycobacterium sp.]MDT5285018.1 hypothetical protein [Mycobacterium sp.]
MDVVPIWLWHKPGAHDDLQLELGDLRRGCCSCNLLLLDDTLTHQTDSFGALARFLQLWLDELDKLCQRPGETFLPFDFYDQGSSWLRVHTGDTIEATVVAGDRSVQGLFLKASEFAEYAHLGFHPWAGTELTCDLNDLIRTLVENRDALNSRSELPVDFSSRRHRRWRLSVAARLRRRHQ